MKPSFLPAFLAAAIAASLAPVTGGRDLAQNADATASRGREIARIRAHFDSVLAELANADVPALSQEGLAVRRELTTTLAAYRDRGVFPRNYDFPARAVPYFVDSRTGTLCAVGHLLAARGRRDIVDRVAARDNNVWVPQLAGDTAFAGWLDAHGITLEEAARIQVPYVGDVPNGSVNDVAPRTSIVALGLVAGTAGLAVWNVTGNNGGRGRLATILGVVTSGASLGMGAAALGDERAPRGLSAVSFVAGGLGSAIAARTWIRQGAASQQRAGTARADASRFQIAPTIPAGGRQGAGVVLSLSF